MYTDICGSFPTASWNDHRYFITFTDDYFRYRYLYLIYEKFQSLDMFKMYKAELKINIIERLKLLDLTMVVSTMADTTDHLDVQNFLLIF